jgi:membrane-associated protease RseP (regulator of RpoE activity)
MTSRLLARAAARVSSFVASLRRPNWSRAELAAFGRRFAHFWFVWSALLLVHEGGHAVSAWREGIAVRRVTVGAGPVLWRGRGGETEFVRRAWPVGGQTLLEPARAGAAVGWGEWGRQAVMLGGGILATLALAVGVAALVAARERLAGARWVWGRLVVADALVLTVFNFLPVPPLDGGRALFEAVAAWRGVPLAGETLFWVQVGGLALAVVPMTLWTRWTARLDAAALWWGAPDSSR